MSCEYRERVAKNEREKREEEALGEQWQNNHGVSNITLNLLL